MILRTFFSWLFAIVLGAAFLATVPYDQTTVKRTPEQMKVTLADSLL